MTYKLKGIGPAWIAMLALGTLSASAAQANRPAALTLEENSATIVGEGEETGVLTRSSRTITCNVTTYHGEAANLDPGISLTPSYEECDSSIAGSVVTVTNTGCQYDLSLAGEEAEGGGETFTAVTDLDCNDGAAQIEIELWLSKASHEEKKAPTCAYTFSDTHEGKPVNQALTGIELANKAAGGGASVNWITADVEIAGIVSTRTVGSTLICGALLDGTGNLHTKASLKAENKAEDEVGGTVSTRAE
jgi:hypothetical protein